MWYKVNFNDEKINIRFDAYLPFLDSKHDDSEVIFNLIEDAMANIKKMYDGSIWSYCEENDYKTNIDEYNDEYANHDRVVIIKNHVYLSQNCTDIFLIYIIRR